MSSSSVLDGGSRMTSGTFQMFTFNFYVGLRLILIILDYILLLTIKEMKHGFPTKDT